MLHQTKQCPCPTEAKHKNKHEAHQESDYHPIVLIQYLSPSRLVPLCTERRGRGVLRSPHSPGQTPVSVPDLGDSCRRVLSLLAHNAPLALSFLGRRATRFLHRAGPLSGAPALPPVNRPLSGYWAFLAASIQGRTTSRFSEAHRLAPASGSSSSLIAYSRPLICSSVSTSASMNA